MGGGLGLYFSNGIVAAHGGRMWAESLGHGQGSTFCFTLPLREERSAHRPAVEHA
jgi:signal transduction histidine kinase